MGCSEPKGMPYSLEFRDKGVGALSATTPFEEAKISAALLGFKLSKYTRFEAGKPKPIYLVQRSSETILEIYPTQDNKYIARIESRSLHVRTTKDIKLGTLLQDSKSCQGDEEQLKCPLSKRVFMLYERNIKSEWIATALLWQRHD
ncbi:MAG: DUF1131 family protein [Campylobacterota bacterium]|nr:DUF1131 family protein [Campylobacterota bacterium]